MKSKCGIRNAACSSAQAIFTNSNPPRLLCSLPSLQELTSPFLSLAAELSSHFHLSQSQQDGRMLGRADRGEQTWLDKLVIVEPHHHRRRRRRPALSAPYPILLCHSVIPFISSNLSSTPFLSSPPPPFLFFFSGFWELFSLYFYWHASLDGSTAAHSASTHTHTETDTLNCGEYTLPVNSPPAPPLRLFIVVFCVLESCKLCVVPHEAASPAPPPPPPAAAAAAAPRLSVCSVHAVRAMPKKVVRLGCLPNSPPPPPPQIKELL